MRTIQTVGVLGALVISGAAAAQGIQGTTKSPAGWPAVVERSNNDALSYTREVLARLHQDNQIEAALGTMARQRGGSSAVRRFGRLLAADRAVADRNLVQYASRERGIPVREPTVVMGSEQELMRKHDAAIQHLETMDGAAFDVAFLTMVVADQQAAIELADNARRSVEDPDLRTILGKALPILRQHLWISQTLLGDAEPSS